MNPQGRTTRRRLGTVVAVVLAVTAGGLTAPACAVAPAAQDSPAAGQAAPFTVPAGSTVVSSGPTGFLTSHTEGTATVHTWVTHDGTPTRLPAGRYEASQGTDLVVRIDGSRRTYLDMSTGRTVASYDTTELAGTPVPLLHQGTSLVTRTFPAAPAGRELHVVGKDAAGRTLDRAVPGLPADELVSVESAGPDTFLARHYSVVGGTWSQKLAVVDVASASVVETYDHVYGQTGRQPAAASATHLAWLELGEYRSVLATARRGGSGITRTDLPLPADPETNARTAVRIVGDWVVYTALGGGTSPRAEALHQVTARSLTTGETVTLLAHASGLVASPDGSLLASGGTLDRGEGVYRIAPGADAGAPPAVTLVATTGVPTALAVTTENAPAGTVDLDRTAGVLKPSWTFDRHNAEARLVIRNTASGRVWTSPTLPPRASSEPFTFLWDGTFDDTYPAFNGAYTWTMTAKPANGIGPDVVRTGSFTLTRGVRPHDFDDNGSPDLLVRDAEGRLALYEGRRYLANPAQDPSLDHEPPSLPPTPIGTGWNTYDRITAAGNLGGTPAGDVVTRDTTGVLWLHQGNGKGLAPRVRVGAGWQVYDQLTAGPDLTGDGRNDLLATDRTGVLWLYPGTGNANAPFSARKRIGGGWSAYNKLVVPGNLGGAAHGDLLARGKDGVLWLYLGKGDGTFAPRTRVGSGWNAYAVLIGIGDLNPRDGHADLIGMYSSRFLQTYAGTGDWRRPFGNPVMPISPLPGSRPTDVY
ncbi:FG-GAP repeat domain-containing protein [Streptomyces sp. NPDC056944]|uniref:FG-GAP repeat domain-containing protein n=1 Tax=Streptomyces sp. NPDC056944 TaxID=3345972 RepID=UPI0036442766